MGYDLAEMPEDEILEKYRMVSDPNRVAEAWVSEQLP